MVGLVCRSLYSILYTPTNFSNSYYPYYLVLRNFNAHSEIELYSSYPEPIVYKNFRFWPNCFLSLCIQLRQNVFVAVETLISFRKPWLLLLIMFLFCCGQSQQKLRTKKCIGDMALMKNFRNHIITLYMARMFIINNRQSAKTLRLTFLHVPVEDRWKYISRK